MSVLSNETCVSSFLQAYLIYCKMGYSEFLDCPKSIYISHKLTEFCWYPLPTICIFRKFVCNYLNRRGEMEVIQRE